MSQKWIEHRREPGDDSDAHPHFRKVEGGKVHIAQVVDINPGSAYRVFHRSYDPGPDGTGDANSEELVYKSKVFASLVEALAHLFDYVGGV